ncbi:MAG TPA: sigma-70 family RNA polymerase sigma factor [Candidatus Rubrimentiphilum sp.]|nr:sigma-70 family RNA polymerase sigma factor [Candidatus Rubrimentiphilum sp.]
MMHARNPAPARETLFDEYGRLCTRACRKFMRPGIDRADLQQIAAIGLIKACDRYDPSVETPFEAFAWLFIIGELMHFVRDHERLVRAPRQLRKMEKQVQVAQESLVSRLGREPSTREIAQHLGVTPADIADAYRCRDRATVESLDALAPYELKPVAYAVDEPENAIVIREALAHLTAPERTIVVAMYAGGYSQLELADRLGYSRRHISRLHRRALKKMRNAVAV